MDTNTIPARRAVGSPPAFDALFNFRDLGGHPTDSGRFTLPGAVFRSDGIHRCTEGDIMVLEDLGVRRVVDLRTERERRDDGSFPTGHLCIEYCHIPLLNDVSGLGEITPDEPLVVSYLRMLDERGPRFADTLSAVVDAGGAVVFHCTAGKDRTGMVAALLLRAVGAGLDSVVEDYAKSELAIARLVSWYRAQGGTDAPVHDPARDDRRRMLMQARPRWMANVLALVDLRYGGAAQYLLDAGTSPATLQALRSLLLG